jgi:hypothetical protein
MHFLALPVRDAKREMRKRGERYRIHEKAIDRVLGLYTYFGSLADICIAKFHVRFACPYRKSNPHVLMMQPAKDGSRFDTPALDLKANIGRQFMRNSAFERSAIQWV